MKKLFFVIYLCIGILLSACGANPAAAPSETAGAGTCSQHTDSDDNWLCDTCQTDVGITIDIISVNDLHGKIADADAHPGVDEMTTYIKNTAAKNDGLLLLSAGDMWQGSAESNMTGGLLMTDWMNQVGFSAMCLGNHEFDWGEEAVESNAELAQFPLLAINIYDRETDTRVSYCESSLLVDKGVVQIGIVGAIGDCYSSISGDKTQDIYFKTGKDLTQLVMDESTRLREQGADFIVYLLHDGYEETKGGSVAPVRGTRLASYYDTDLSNGYVDLVFEGHTHQRYILQDEYSVYHLQNGGDNKGLSQVSVKINGANGNYAVQHPRLIATGNYATLDDDPIVEELLAKYDDQISLATKVVGQNSQERRRNELRQLVADLYYETGVEYWGEEYDIVLGGGFLSVRDPGYLAPGDVTYGMLNGLFPFDNQLVLCSIQGKDLKSRFFETDNSSYFISYGQYGEQVRQNIDPNATYYVVVDSYSSVYGPNKLTEIARYEDKIYARDLLADYIGTGALS